MVYGRRCPRLSGCGPRGHLCSDCGKADCRAVKLARWPRAHRRGFPSEPGEPVVFRDVAHGDPGRGTAPVAQRIEHLITDQKVGGSNPSGRALLRQDLNALEMSRAFGVSSANPLLNVLLLPSDPVIEVTATGGRRG